VEKGVALVFVTVMS